MRDAVGIDTLPVLPDRRRAAVDHRQPRRRGVLEQQLVGEVEVAGVGEHRQQVRRGEEAGIEVGARGADELDEPVGSVVAQVRRGSDRTRVRARSRPDACCVLHRRRSTNSVCQASRTFRASTSYRSASSGRSSTRAMAASVAAECAKYAVAMMPKSWRPKLAKWSMSSSIGFAPFTPVEAGVPQELFVGSRLRVAFDAQGMTAGVCRAGLEVDPGHHRRPLLLEEPPVAVRAPHRPRDEHGGITPSG